MFPYAKNEEELRSNLEEAVADAIGQAPDGLVSRLLPKLLEVDYPAQTLVFEYPSEPWMRNPAGHMHGGMIATILDNAMCTAVRGIAGIGDSPTVSLQVSYVRPVRIGIPVGVTVRVSGCGRTMAYLSAEVWQGDNRKRILATGSSAVFVAKG